MQPYFTMHKNIASVLMPTETSERVERILAEEWGEQGRGADYRLGRDEFFEQLLELAELWTADATRPITSAVHAPGRDVSELEMEAARAQAVAKEYVAFLSALQPFAFPGKRGGQVTEKDRQAVQRWRVAVSEDWFFDSLSEQRDAQVKEKEVAKKAKKDAVAQNATQGKLLSKFCAYASYTGFYLYIPMY